MVWNGIRGSNLRDRAGSHLDYSKTSTLVAGVSRPIAERDYPGVTGDAYSVELHEIESAGYRNLMRPYDHPIPLRAP